eukprot:m.11466 g.11466  ORF g.11466 m.11466 type:complete len:289 (-) comp15520_c0_seq2:387-1253(-)
MKLAIFAAASALIAVAAALHPSGWAEITGGKTLMDGCIEAGGSAWADGSLDAFVSDHALRSILAFLELPPCRKARITNNVLENSYFGRYHIFTRPTTPNALACCLVEGCRLPDGSLTAGSTPVPPAGAWNVVVSEVGFGVIGAGPLNIIVNVPTMADCEADPFGFTSSCLDEDGNGVFTYSPSVHDHIAHIHDSSGSHTFVIKAAMSVFNPPVSFTHKTAVVTIKDPSGQVTAIKVSDILADPTQLANAQSSDPIFSIWNIGSITFTADGSTFTATNSFSVAPVIEDG